MSQRLDYSQQSPELTRKLFELTQASKKSSLGHALLDLINIRVSQMNGCAFCVDMHCKEAKIHGERELRLYHVPIWRESGLFSEKEKAALEWAEAVTKLCPDELADDVYERVRTQFGEKEITELTFAVAIINTWNRLCISFRTTPGSADEVFGLTKAGLK